MPRPLSVSGLRNSSRSPEAARAPILQPRAKPRLAPVWMTRKARLGAVQRIQTHGYVGRVVVIDKDELGDIGVGKDRTDGVKQDRACPVTHQSRR